MADLLFKWLPALLAQLPLLLLMFVSFQLLILEPGFCDSGDACMFGCVQLFAAQRTAAHQTPLSTGFFRQGYRGGLPFPTPGGLPDPGIEQSPLVSPALAGRFFTNCEAPEDT